MKTPMGVTVAGDERPPKLICAWCELPDLLPHEHHYGQIPLTPCRACCVANHGACEPAAPYFCTCDCGLKGAPDVE
jgi:hypothetical protein